MIPPGTGRRRRITDRGRFRRTKGVIKGVIKGMCPEGMGAVSYGALRGRREGEGVVVMRHGGYGAAGNMSKGAL